jgi:hypothetical protein
MFTRNISRARLSGCKFCNIVNRPFEACPAMRFDSPDSFRGITGKQPEVEFKIDFSFSNRSVIVLRTAIVVNMDFTDICAKGFKPLFQADRRSVKKVPVADIEAVANPWMIE